MNEDNPMWPYDQMPNRGMNPRTTNIGTRRNTLLDLLEGQAGAQSGPVASTPREMSSENWRQEQGQAAPMQGQNGSQSGVASSQPSIFDELVDIIRRYNRGVPQNTFEQNEAGTYYENFPRR